MSVPIDYWDYIGWKDTLADPRNTARQRGYAHARGDGKVYTPQAIVNGSLHALGSDGAAIEHAIAKSRRFGAMSLPLRLIVADGRLEVAVPDAAEERGGRRGLDVGNSRKLSPSRSRAARTRAATFTHHNVVRRGLKLGDWNGKAGAWSLPLSALAGDGIDRAAVLVQSGRWDKPKAILGAALASIR